MRNILFICCLYFTLYSNCFAQDTKYPYKYRLNIPAQPSYYYFTYDTINKYPSDTSYFLLDLNIIDNNIRHRFAGVKLIFEKGDTLELTQDYLTGVVKKRISFDDFRLKIKSFTGADIDFYVPVYNKPNISKVTVVLGQYDKLFIPIIESKRPLTDKEIIELINDIKNDIIKDSRLIKEKTCKYSFEI